MFRQIITAFTLTLLLIAALAYVKYSQIAAAIAEGANFKMPPTTVTTSTVKEQVWPRTFQAVGSLAAVRGATLGFEQSGRIAKIHFESGQQTTEGTVLIELDWGVEQAELESAQANLELAKLSAERQRALRKRNANSIADLDNAELTLASSRAEVQRLRALLRRRKIVAPFDGVLGIRQVDIGQFVALGEPAVSLQLIDKLHANFSVPQQYIGQFALGSTVEIKSTGISNNSFKAQVSAIESQVDSITRTIAIQATISNESQLLRPGMFVSAAMILSEEETVLSIPTSSVSFAPYGDSVYVVEPAKTEDAASTVRAVTVKLGRQVGDMIAVTHGLSQDQEVVTSGVFQLRPGQEIVVNNETTPTESLSPTPQDT